GRAAFLVLVAVGRPGDPGRRVLVAPAEEERRDDLVRSEERRVGEGGREWIERVAVGLRAVVGVQEERVGRPGLLVRPVEEGDRRDQVVGLTEWLACRPVRFRAGRAAFLVLVAVRGTRDPGRRVLVAPAEEERRDDLV